MLTMPLVGGADLNGTASGDPTDLRFNHPYRASPTGLHVARKRTLAQSSKSLLHLRSANERRAKRYMKYEQFQRYLSLKLRNLEAVAASAPPSRRAVEA
eukprot:6211922-Pleurochrysis_carterae.AAC.2